MRTKAIKNETSQFTTQVLWTLAVLASILTAAALLVGKSLPSKSTSSHSIPNLGESAVAEAFTCNNHVALKSAAYSGSNLHHTQNANPLNLPREDTFFLQTNIQNKSIVAPRLSEETIKFEITGMTKATWQGISERTDTGLFHNVSTNCPPSPSSDGALEKVVVDTVEGPSKDSFEPAQRKL